MPIDISEFAEPTLVRYKERYPLSDNRKDRFMDFGTMPRSYRGDGGTFPQPGYNPNHQSTRVEKVNLETDDITLKGR